MNWIDFFLGYLVGSAFGGAAVAWVMIRYGPVFDELTEKVSRLFHKED